MARIKRSVNSIKKRRKVLRLAKGYFGAKSKQYRAASQQVMKSMAYAYVGRKNKKREYRRLWIARINAGARLDRPYQRRRPYLRHQLLQPDQRPQAGRR